jgi:hypothetical protein
MFIEEIDAEVEFGGGKRMQEEIVATEGEPGSWSHLVGAECEFIPLSS